MTQDKIDQALQIIKSVGLPREQHNERSALSLLALLNLTPEKSWKDAEAPVLPPLSRYQIKVEILVLGFKGMWG